MSAMIEMLFVPLLACALMTAMLGYLGIHVLKREVVFIDIALAQIAALGAITAHLALAAGHDSLLSFGCALGATFVAAAFFAHARRTVSEIPLEAIIGVTYAIAAGACLFAAGVATGGHVHVQELLAGSILWATWHQIVTALAAFVVVGVCFFLCRRPFNAISEDYEAARARGVRVARWDFLFYALFGVVITLSVRVAGVVVVFAFLIIPATASAMFSARTVPRLLIAWAIGVTASAAGLLSAYRWDYSVGPSVAFCLGLLLAFAVLVRACLEGPNARFRRRVPAVRPTEKGFAASSGREDESLE
ncbi:MAG: metal ABC transporter permease [Candidatus Hydrogenedentes bacterium]|nr:metal ABC transporter permease [Candidatus Hydrogenedentota bacterium]